MISIPKKYRPLIVIVALVAFGGIALFVVDVLDIGEGSVGPCCATEFDPTPYQQVPAKAP